MGGKKSRFKTISLYVILEFGTLLGVPMRPEDVERMTRQLNNAVVLVEEEGEREGNPPEPPSPR